MNASYVCSDPKGTVIEEVGRALVRGGYKIKVLNTIDFSCSMHYNPFVYLHSETDILTLVTVIMTNTQGEAPPIPPKKLSGMEMTSAQGQEITRKVKAL